VIKYKLPLRIVQNCHITLNNVVIPAEQKLPKANDFSGTNIVLKHSRVYVCWVAAGIAMGVYDNAIKFVSSRKQFGQPISGIYFVKSRFPTDSIKDRKNNVKHSGNFPFMFQNIKTY
jgi:glutaryl-CoA dehydrogenase